MTSTLATVLSDMAGILTGAGAYHVTRIVASKPQPITCYDGVTVADLPEGHCYFAYVNGPYENYAAIKARFPEARIITIATDARYLASLLDIERGAATPAQLASWHAMCLDHGIYKPGAYASLDNTEAWQAVKQLPIGKHQSIVADWTGVPHIPAGYSGCQYKNTPSYDVSQLVPGWFP